MHVHVHTYAVYLIRRYSIKIYIKKWQMFWKHTFHVYDPSSVWRKLVICKQFSSCSRRVIHPKCLFFKNIQHFLVFKYRNIASSAIWHCCQLSRIIQNLQTIWRLQIFDHISQSPDQRNKNLVDNHQSNWTLKHCTKENFKR